MCPLPHPPLIPSNILTSSNQHRQSLHLILWKCAIYPKQSFFYIQQRLSRLSSTTPLSFSASHVDWPRYHSLLGVILELLLNAELSDVHLQSDSLPSSFTSLTRCLLPAPWSLHSAGLDAAWQRWCCPQITSLPFWCHALEVILVTDSHPSAVTKVM